MTKLAEVVGSYALPGFSGSGEKEVGQASELFNSDVKKSGF